MIPCLWALVSRPGCRQAGVFLMSLRKGLSLLLSRAKATDILSAGASPCAPLCTPCAHHALPLPLRAPSAAGSLQGELHRGVTSWSCPAWAPVCRELVGAGLHGPSCNGRH